MPLAVDIVDAFLIVSVDREGGEVAEVQLDDVVAGTSHDFLVIDSDCFLEINYWFRFPRSFPHFLHFEERILGDEEGFEVEESHQIFILFVIFGNLIFGRFGPLLNDVVILLSKLKYEVGLLCFVETAHHPARQ